VYDLARAHVRGGLKRRTWEALHAELLAKVPPSAPKRYSAASAAHAVELRRTRHRLQPQSHHQCLRGADALLHIAGFTAQCRAGWMVERCALQQAPGEPCTDVSRLYAPSLITAIRAFLTSLFLSFRGLPNTSLLVA